MSGEEKAHLYSLSQADRNKTVAEWAQKVGWVTKEITGEDGVIYCSFMPREEV
jgi:hypothetical protein